jgi:REP element-mobilizing transposase RayT
MPKPRESQVSLEATPYYHCVSRCVRRAFLCGEDHHSGRSFEHRRGWIEDRLKQLAEVFAVDVCAYAIMSNHYHVVLHVDAKQAEGWDERRVAERWAKLFSIPDIVQHVQSLRTTTQAERDVASELIELWRSRLHDISWFMRCLNEPIARSANTEDNCTGRFWEGRFKSQALLDDKALAAAMAYVDLNPVRAGMADSPEVSEYTSIKARIDKAGTREAGRAEQPGHLLAFVGNPRQDMPKGLPFPLSAYLELVDWTGRVIIEGKTGAISGELPPILERLEIDPKYWVYMAQSFESRFKGLVGTAHSLKKACQALRYQRTPNLAVCRELLS